MDFPFYNGKPAYISGRQWLLVMAAVSAGFLSLVLPVPWPTKILADWVPAILFAWLPLAALAYVAPGHWKAIFGKVRGRELKLMVGFALLNIVVSMSVGSLVAAFADVAPNAATARLTDMDTADRVTFFAKTVPQLFGEEVVTLLPFLAVLHFFTARLGAGRKQAVVAAWLISSLAFALIHLPTYNWHWIQCIVVIGSARMVLTLPWILTKNIWVSTGAHIVNDWMLFTLGLLGPVLVGKG